MMPITDQMLVDAVDLYDQGDETAINEQGALATAYHEMGHLLIDVLCSNHPSFVTIVARGDYLGYTAADMHENSGGWKKQDYLNRICMSFGGRAAEQIIYGDAGINSGASSELRQATSYARYMICNLGMGNTLISLGGLRQDEIPQKMLDEIDEVLHEQYSRCCKYLEDNRGLLEALTQALYKDKSLTGPEIEKIIENIIVIKNDKGECINVFYDRSG